MLAIPQDRTTNGLGIFLKISTTGKTDTTIHSFAHAHLRVFCAHVHSAMRARVYNLSLAIYLVPSTYEIMIKRVLAVYSLPCLVTLLHLQLALASADQPVTWR